MFHSTEQRPAGFSRPITRGALGLMLAFISDVGLAREAHAQSNTTLAPSTAVTKPAPSQGDAGWIESILRKSMSAGGFAWGSAAHMRIYKEENVLEMWLKKGSRYEKFKDFKICKWSGKLGPKLQEGDKQSPEGVYSVTRKQLLGRTKNHRAVNLDFPNVFDRRMNRTGSALQIHGGCGSIGCYAMTDRGIEEIYRILDASFKGGQSRVATHIFPFRLTDEKLIARKSHPSSDYWSMLQPIYKSFETTRKLPGVRVCGTRYVAPGDKALPPEQCAPVWQADKLTLASLSKQTDADVDTRPKVIAAKTEAKPKQIVKRKPRPSIVVKCNLRLPSCKRWLANQRRKLARRGVRSAGIRQAGASYVRKGGRSSGVATARTSPRRNLARERRRRALRR